MGRKPNWKNENYVKAYRLACDGMTDTAVAHALGMGHTQFADRAKTDPALAEALKSGRAGKGGGNQDFSKFIMGRMPPEAAKLWAELEDVGRDLGLREKAWKKVDQSPLRVRMHIFVQALVSAGFVVNKACMTCGVARNEVESWAKSDGAFRAILAGVQEHKGDFFESALMALVKAGDTAATLFANRTYNRKRGYSDKVQISVDGEVGVTHRHTLDSLPLEMRRALLEAVRGERRNPELIESKNLSEDEA